MECRVVPQNLLARHASGDVIHHDGAHDTRAANTRTDSWIYADSLSPVLHNPILIALSCRAPSSVHAWKRPGLEVTGRGGSTGRCTSAMGGACFSKCEVFDRAA